MSAWIRRTALALVLATATACGQASDAEDSGAEPRAGESPGPGTAWQTGLDRLGDFHSGTFSYRLSQRICTDPERECLGGSRNYWINVTKTSSPDTLLLDLTDEYLTPDKRTALNVHDSYALLPDGRHVARVRGQTCWKPIEPASFPLVQQVLDQGIKVLEAAVLPSDALDADLGRPVDAEVPAGPLLRAARIWTGENVSGRDQLVPIEITYSEHGRIIGFAGSGTNVYPRMTSSDPELADSDSGKHIRGVSISFEIRHQPVEPAATPRICR